MTPKFEALPFEPLFEVINHLPAMDVLSLQRVSKTMEVIITHFEKPFIREALKNLYDVPTEHIRWFTSTVKTLEDLHRCEQTAELAREFTKGRRQFFFDRRSRRPLRVPHPHFNILINDTAGSGTFRYSLCLLDHLLQRVREEGQTHCLSEELKVLTDFELQHVFGTFMYLCRKLFAVYWSHFPSCFIPPRFPTPRCHEVSRCYQCRHEEFQFSCFRPFVYSILKKGLVFLAKASQSHLDNKMLLERWWMDEWMTRETMWDDDLHWWFENEIRRRGMTLHSTIIDSRDKGIVRGIPSPWESVFSTVLKGGQLWRLGYIPGFEKGTWDEAIDSSDKGSQFENNQNTDLSWDTFAPSD